MNCDTANMMSQLRNVLHQHAADLGAFTWEDDAKQLRKISMTLRRWHELECGMDAGAIERCEETGKPFWRNETRGRYGLRELTPIADREAGAKRRLARIMARYPSLTAYIQTDPRGCALYILRPGDVPAGSSVDSCYSRGLAVFK